MKRVSEAAQRDDASRGKNQPMAKLPDVTTQQNGEVAPTKHAASQQPGTDQARRKR